MGTKVACIVPALTTQRVGTDTMTSIRPKPDSGLRTSGFIEFSLKPLSPYFLIYAIPGIKMGRLLALFALFPFFYVKVVQLVPDDIELLVSLHAGGFEFGADWTIG